MSEPPIFEGDILYGALEQLDDDTILALFADRGLFTESRIQPNEIYQLPTGIRIRLTDNQYQHMRARVRQIKQQREQLLKAPKQTLRKRLF